MLSLILRLFTFREKEKPSFLSAWSGRRWAKRCVLRRQCWCFWELLFVWKGGCITDCAFHWLRSHPVPGDICTSMWYGVALWTQWNPNGTASCVKEEGMAAPDYQHIWPLVSMEHYGLLSLWVISPRGSCMKITFNKGDKHCRDKREWRIC